MRLLLILVGLLLTACSHYEPPALHGAASMRVEVEVYKGPLTVSPAGQVGQIVAEVSDSVRAVTGWQQRAVDLRTEKCAGDALDTRDCRQLRNAMSSANAILGAACYLLKSPTLMETVGRAVYIPMRTCEELPPVSVTAAYATAYEAAVALDSAKQVAAKKTAAHNVARARAAPEIASASLAAADKTAADRIAVSRASSARRAEDRAAFYDAAAKQAVVAKAEAEKAVVAKATAYEAATKAPAAKAAAEKASKELASARASLVAATNLSVSASRDAVEAKADWERAVALKSAADEDVRAKGVALKTATDRATPEFAAAIRAGAERAAAEEDVSEKATVSKTAMESAAATAAAAETADYKIATERATEAESAATQRAQIEFDQATLRRKRSEDAFKTCMEHAIGARNLAACNGAVSRVFGQFPDSSPRIDPEVAKLEAFQACLQNRSGARNPGACQIAILKKYGPAPGPAATQASLDVRKNYAESLYRAQLDADIRACIADNQDSIVKQLKCEGDVITVAFSNTSTILTTAADRSSDAYVRGAPEDPEIRGLLVQFGQIANEYGNKLSARTIVLAKVMNQEDFDGKKLPVSDYLRGSEATDYLQLFDWLNASEEASGNPRVGKLSVAERIRVAQRLAAGENWQKVNEVYASGQGEVGMAFIKDDLGNWNLKSFSSDPTELLAAYRNVTSAALKTAADLTTKAALGPAGSAGARLGDAARATQLATQLATGGVPATPGVVGGVNIAAMHQRTAVQIAAQRERYVTLEKQLLADLTGQDTALNTAKQKTAGDRLTLTNKQSALTTAETNRDKANDTLQIYLAVIRTKEAEGTVVEAQDRINATNARDAHLQLQRNANSAYGEVVAAQAVVDEDVAAEKTLEAKKAAAAQRLADLPKDAIESLRGTLDQYAGVVADLQSGVAAASPASAAPGRSGGALPALPQ